MPISIDELISVSSSFLGYPAVRWSQVSHDPHNLGNNPTGFDCSGIWQYVLLKMQYDLKHEKLGRNVRFSREFFDYFGSYVQTGDEKRGDLVFFSWDGVMPTHMGLYIGDNKIIHKGYIETSLTQVQPTGDYQKRIIISNLDQIAKDERNAGQPIEYRKYRGEQRYGTNPIGFKRFIFE